MLEWMRIQKLHMFENIEIIRAEILSNIWNSSKKCSSSVRYKCVCKGKISQATHGPNKWSNITLSLHTCNSVKKWHYMNQEHLSNQELLNSKLYVSWFFQFTWSRREKEEDKAARKGNTDGRLISFGRLGRIHHNSYGYVSEREKEIEVRSAWCKRATAFLHVILRCDFVWARLYLLFVLFIVSSEAHM